MPFTRKIARAGLSALLTAMPFIMFASHITGGGFTYRYLGDTIISGVAHGKYEVSLYLYQDCVTGVPEAINQDNPAYFTIYRSDGVLTRVDTNVYYDANPASDGSIQVPVETETVCGKVTVGAHQCLLRKKFTKIYYLPAENYGYTIVNQRCCRSSSAINIKEPDAKGNTFFCEIPAATANKNTSAVFTNHPQQIMCLHTTNVTDQSARDADGDSLSYALDIVYDGASGPDIKPKVCTPPPYDTIEYKAGYGANQPMSGDGAVTIDEKTGVLTVRPNVIGVYQAAILCREWRGGQIINTIRREFIWTVLDCGVISNFKPDAGGNRTVLTGDTLQFNATNADRYMWMPGTFLNNAFTGDPVGTFTTPGEYTYVLVGENNKGCTGTDTIKVRVLEHTEYTAPRAFTPNGDGINDMLRAIAVGNSILKTMRVYNRWGNVLFSTKDHSLGWDGTYKGKQQDAGVYVWQIEYIDSFGEQRVASGSVVLIR